MPGMSPRIKAKKGRFGLDGLAPLLNLVSFATTATNLVGQTGFEANANDDLDGVLTASITWTSDLDGLLGTGGTPTLTFTTVATHTVTVEVTDGTNVVSTTFQIAVA